MPALDCNIVESTFRIEQEAPRDPCPLPSHNPTKSYWLETSSFHLDNGGVEIPHYADVVIIGSGITGTSVAYHLVQHLPPDSVVVILEARQFCSGATARNGGHLTPVSALSYIDLVSSVSHLASPNTDTANHLVRQILEFEQRTERDLLEATRHVHREIELVRGKNWHLCFQQSEIERFEKNLNEAKNAGLQDFVEKVRRVSKEEIKRRLHKPKDVIAAYEIPGNTLHPRKLVIELFRKAKQIAETRNVQLLLFENTPVLKVNQESLEQQQRQGKDKKLVKAEVVHATGKVRTRVVVHATNGYVSHLLPQYAGPKGVVPTRAQVIAVEPLPNNTRESVQQQDEEKDEDKEMQEQEEDGWILVHSSDSHSIKHHDMLWPMGFSSNSGWEYCQQRPTPPPNHSSHPPPFILGGGREHASSLEWGISDDSFCNPDVSLFLDSWLPNHFTSTSHSLEWTGIMGYTFSTHPIVGPVLKHPPFSPSSSLIVSGQFLAVGYSGHGMTRAFGVAQFLSLVIVSEEEKGKEKEVVSTDSWFPGFLVVIYRFLIHTLRM